MAFDDLPFGAHDLLIELLEAHRSGNYNPVFYAASTDAGGWSIRLEGVNANEDKELRGFSEGDLLDLEINRYLTHDPRQPKNALSLAPKAFEQFHLSQAAATLSSHGLHKSSSADMPPKKDGIDIFISHSHQDEKLADALANFLDITFPNQKIRCTSVPGFKLEPGASVEETLRSEIHESRVFIGLITPASLSSHFVLFELGARWSARLDLIPVLALGADSRDLQEPLKNRNPVRCDVRAEIRSLVNKIASVLGVSPSNIAYESLVNGLVRKAKPGGQDKRKQEEAKPSGAGSATSTESVAEKRKRIRALLSQEIAYNVKYLNGINDTVKSEEIKYRETFKTDEYGAWSSEGNPIRALRRFQPDSLSQRAWTSQIEQAPLALTEDELASVFSFYGALNGISISQEKFLSAPTVSDFFDEVIGRIDAILEGYPKLQ